MGKTSGHRTTGSGKSRRETVLRNVPKPTFSIGTLLRRPEFLRTCFIIFLFLVIVSGLATWSMEQIKVRDGQIAPNTRITRIDFEEEDITATETKREEASNSSPRIYITNSTFVERLNASLLGLPTAVSGKGAIEEVATDLVEQFRLTPESLAALQRMSMDGEATNSWVDRKSVV